jgi:hypothetical protein
MAPAAAFDAEAGATNGNGVSHGHGTKPGLTAVGDAGAAFVLESKGTDRLRQCVN